MSHLDFGPVMWPTAYKYGNKFHLDRKSKKFLTGMVKVGLARKMSKTEVAGEKYYV